MKVIAASKVFIFALAGAVTLGCGDTDNLVCTSNCGDAQLAFASTMSSASGIDALDLGLVLAGGDVSRFVFLRNDGPQGTTVTLNDITMVDPTGRLSARVDGELPRVLGSFTGAMADVAIVEVRATAFSPGPIEGRLVVEADVDGVLEVIELPVSGDAIVSELSVWPSVVEVEAVVGRSATQMIVIGNHGPAALTVTGVEVGDVVNFAVDIKTKMPIVLEPSEEAMFALTFAPARVVGHYDTKLAFSVADAADRTIDVRALALEPPVAVFEAMTIDFGDVAFDEVSSRAITIENTGGADLHLSMPYVLEDGGEAFQACMDDTVVLPGRTTSLIVELRPERLGDVRGFVIIKTDDPGASKVAVPLSARVIMH